MRWTISQHLCKFFLWKVVEEKVGNVVKNSAEEWRHAILDFNEYFDIVNPVWALFNLPSSRPYLLPIIPPHLQMKCCSRAFFADFLYSCSKGPDLHKEISLHFSLIYPTFLIYQTASSFEYNRKSDKFSDESRTLRFQNYTKAKQNRFRDVLALLGISKNCRS